MNHYTHHIGDWLRKTIGLSAQEEGLYLRLCHWCYANEQPLPADIHELRRIARCRGRSETRALESIVAHFFTLKDDGYHQGRIDSEIAKYGSMSNHLSDQGRLQSAHRQAVSRQYRASLFAKLRAVGFVAPYNTTNNELNAMLNEYAVTGHVTAPLPREVTVNHEPVTNNQRGVAVAPPPLGARGAPAPARPPPHTHANEGTEAAAAAMRTAGLVGVNPLHPMLQRLLAEGATAEEFSLTAAESHARGKGFVYALAMLAGRRADGQKWGNGGNPGLGNGAGSTPEELERAYFEIFGTQVPTTPK